MPRPKYRAPPKKEHKEKLDAFSFGSAWRKRRKSLASQYSPMGSRLPSRRASLASRRSVAVTLPGEEEGDEEARGWMEDAPPAAGGAGGGEREREKGMRRGAARPTRLSAEVEAEGDDDVANVGLSRVQSREKPVATPSAPLSRQVSADVDGGDSNANLKVPGAAPDKRGKSADPLARVMGQEQGYKQRRDQVASDHQPFTEEDLALAMQRSQISVPTQG